MKKFHSTLLCCPTCKSSLSLRIFSEESAGSETEIIDGLFICECERTYPIIGGIPRFLSGSFFELLPLRYPEWFNSYGDNLVNKSVAGSDATSAEDAIKLKTLESFSFEWEHFVERLGSYKYDCGVHGGVTSEIFKRKCSVNEFSSRFLIIICLLEFG